MDDKEYQPLRPTYKHTPLVEFIDPVPIEKFLPPHKEVGTPNYRNVTVQEYYGEDPHGYIGFARVIGHLVLFAVGVWVGTWF